MILAEYCKTIKTLGRIRNEPIVAAVIVYESPEHGQPIVLIIRSIFQRNEKYPALSYAVARFGCVCG
jgi:hypothetical protein